MTSKALQIEKIRERIVMLTDSPLYSYRTKNHYQPVIGHGNLDAKVVFVGEAPGKNEAETGIPFSGAAGKVLNELLTSIDLNREDVYITNIVNDRPPGNRDPHPDEIALYSPFLLEQLQIIQPQVIATLGRFSMEFMLKTCSIPEHTKTIGVNHGKAFSAKVSYGKVLIFPLYHPAAALYQNSLKQTLFEDIKKLGQQLIG